MDAQYAELSDDASEASMLMRRLRVFHFTQKFKPPQKIHPCPSCFGKFIQEHAARSARSRSATRARQVSDAVATFAMHFFTEIDAVATFAMHFFNEMLQFPSM